MKTRILKGHYKDESGLLNQGKLILTTDGEKFGDEYGTPVVASRYTVTDDLQCVEITGPMVGWTFVPDAGECERVGMPINA